MKGGKHEQEKKSAANAAATLSHIISPTEITPSLLNCIKSTMESYDSTGICLPHPLPEHPHSPFWPEHSLIDQISDMHTNSLDKGFTHAVNKPYEFQDQYSNETLEDMAVSINAVLNLTMGLSLTSKIFAGISKC